MKEHNQGHFGKGSIIKYTKNLTIEKGSTYNDFCWINARYGISIGQNTVIGPYVIMQTVNHIIKNIDIEQNAKYENRLTGKPIKIGNDVWIGAGVIILPGSIIPDKCVIGAGALITEEKSKSLEEGSVAISEHKLLIINNRSNYV